jgi:putative peptidoglycan lipid II flippase
VLFLVVPAMTGLIILALPITQLLFEHGRFTRAETLLTYGALAAYSLGLPAFATSKIFASAFYALKDTRTPVKVATGCVLINVVGNITLMRPFGVMGLAFATTLASAANAGVLCWLLRRRLGALGGRRMLKTFLLSALATVGMAAAARGTLWLLSGYGELAALGGALAAGAAVYFGTARLLNMEEESRLWSLIRSKTST